MNVVELLADEQATDQRCRFGNRVEGHAVYCHNESWEDSPRKCRRSWYTGGEVKDEDCPGFQPNVRFAGVLSPSPIQTPLCSACGGTRLQKTERDNVATCDRCMGDGSEPVAIELTQFQENALSMGLRHTGKYPADCERYVVIAESREDMQQIGALEDMSLIQVHSMHSTKAGALAYLVGITGKGEATLCAIWRKRDPDQQPTTRES